MNLKRKMRKGFTLVELVVVIAVIAVLAAVSVGAYFGVTDSANSSAADQTNKQVRDLWVMYSVGEYKDNSSVYDNATDFCLRYFEENGQGDVDINFKTGDESKGEILLKIETAYPTYIYIEDKKIVEYSEICKSEEAFVEAVSSSELVADSFKNDQPFEIESFEFEGETVRGFRYYKVNIHGLNDNSDVAELIVRNGEPIINGDDASVASALIKNDIGAMGQNGNYKAFGSSFNVYNYEEGIKGEEFDTSLERNFEIEENFNITKYENDKYGYITSDLNILYEKNSSTDTINLTNYPVCVATVTYNNRGNVSNFSANLYKTIKDYCNHQEISKDENGFYNIEHTTYNKDTNNGFIFLGNTYIDDNINFKNFNIIAECYDTVEKLSAYVGYKYNKGNNPYESIQYVEPNLFTNGSSERMIHSTIPALENTWEFNTVSKITINEGTIINLQSSNVSVEAILGVPLGNNSTTPGFEVKLASQIINNGTINLDENSIYRSLGLTTGSGSINTTHGSKIIEPFKLNSEQGTGENNLKTNYENKYFIFPIYHFDSIRCNANIKTGALYKLIIPLYVTPMSKSVFITSCTTFIGNITDKPLFVLEQGSISKSRNGTHNRNILTLNEETRVNDCNYRLSVQGSISFVLGSVEYGFEVSNTEFNFSISNIEFIISNNATLTLSNSGIYELNPFSRFEIKEGGTLNVNSGKLGVLNFTEQQFNEMLSASVNNSVQQKIFNAYRNIDASSMFVNEGTINVSNGAILCFADRTNIDFGVINDLDQTNFNKYTYKYLTGPVSYGALELNYWRDQITN